MDVLLPQALVVLNAQYLDKRVVTLSIRDGQVSLVTALQCSEAALLR
jgi:hypothetical protein